MKRGIRKKRIKEEILQEGQKAILERMPQLAMVVNAKGELLYINKAFGKYTKEAILGRSIFKFIDKSSLPEVKKALLRGYKKHSGKYLSKTIPVLGVTRFFESHYSPYRHGKKIVGVLIISTDVTEREVAKSALEEQSQKYFGIIDTLREGVFILDKKAKFTFANPAAAEIYDFHNTEEMIGKSIFDFILPSGYTRLMKTYKNALANKKIPDVYQTEMMTKTGQKKIVEAQVSLIKKGEKVIGARGLIRDITERVKAQHTLNLFMKGFETSPNSELLVAFEKKKPVIKWVNKAFTKMYGYSSSDVIGENPSILSSGKLTKEDYKKIWKDVLDPKVGTWSGEIINRTKSGELLPVILTISTIFNEKKQPTYFTASHIDISGRKSIEERLSLAQFAMDESSTPIYILRHDGSFQYVNNAALRATGYSKQEFLEGMKVFDIHSSLSKSSWEKMWDQVTRNSTLVLQTEHLTKDQDLFPVEVSANRIEYGGEAFNLVYAKDISERMLREEQAEEVNKMKGEFVSLASHQLRTPLTAIRWGLEMIQDEIQNQQNPRLLSIVDDVHASSKRMIDLVSALLNVSRIESGKIKVDSKPTHFKNLIEDVIKELTPIARAKNVQIVFEKPKKKLAKVKIDPSLTRQVVLNLIGNAIKYSQPGEKPVEVTVFIDKEKRQTLQVKDYGIGIRKEEQNRIFERFYRAQNAIARETDGNGLGLYIAKIIMDQVGGDVSFTSELNKGSIFYLALPKKGMSSKKGLIGLESTPV